MQSAHHAYCYIGPAELNVELEIPRRHVTYRNQIEEWLNRREVDQCSVTYIVNQAEELWISDRQTEHVVCAQGKPVLAAGEIGFLLNQTIEIEYVSNQSLGYCLPQNTWSVTQRVLDRLEIPHPGEFTLRCEFRRCENSPINRSQAIAALRLVCVGGV